MVAIHRRVGLIFQGVILIAAVAGAQPEIESQGGDQEAKPVSEEVRPLRFGDPDSTLMREAEAEVEEEFAPLIDLSSEAELEEVEEPLSIPDPSPEAKPDEPVLARPLPSQKEEPSKDVEAKVREIIASVPPGNDYPNEFAAILEIGEQAVPTLSDIFLDMRMRWQSRWIAGMGLGRLGGEQSREALTSGLTDPLFLIRMAAVKAMGNMNDMTLAPLMRSTLSDKAMVVRSAAADALGQIQDPGAVPDLVAEFSHDRNFHRGRSLWVREHIIDALGDIGDNQALPTVISALQEKEEKIRKSACLAMYQLIPTEEPKTKTQSTENCVSQWLEWKKNQDVTLQQNVPGMSPGSFTSQP